MKIRPGSFKLACRLPLLLALAGAVSAVPVAAAQAASGRTTQASAPEAESPAPRKTLDRSGKRQKGKASYYSRRFAGKKMADGRPMNPNAHIAASKTLPLGTKAKVTNLENNKSTTVEIEDRGPYVKGRIVDLSPKAAEEIDMKQEGVAPVEVKPLAVPQGNAGGTAETSGGGAPRQPAAAGASQ